MRRLVCLLLGLVWTCLSWSQLDSLALFRVVRVDTKVGVSGALVKSTDLPARFADFTTDAEGYFSASPKLLGTAVIVNDGFFTLQVDLSKKLRVLELVPLEIALGVAEIKAFEREQKWLEQPLEASVLPPHLLRVGDQSSMQNAVNFIPGVDMNSRGYGGSARFSIRGSIVRAPFGVRGVRFYRNGFPMTGPDGSTSIEMLDPEEINNISVIKAPAGSLYGSSQGGVVLVDPIKPEFVKKEAYLETMLGAYGHFRSLVRANVGGEKWALRISAINRENDGYRQQEWNFKQHLILDHRSRLNDRNTLVSYFNRFTGGWALPGGLTAAEVANNPRMAQTPAIDNNTRVLRVHNFGGIGIDTKGGRLSQTTRVYFHQTDKKNPYATGPSNSGYKVEEAFGSGLRSVFNFSLVKKDSSSLELLAGTELQAEQWNIDEGALSDGLLGDAKYSIDAFSTNANFFTEMQWVYNSLRINAGLAYQQADFNAEGYSSVLDQPLNRKFRFANQLAPGFRFLWQASSHWSVSGSHSRGFNYPDFFELVDVATGYLNDELEQETASASEFGVKADYKFMRLAISVFRTDYFNLILGEIDQEERISYKNLGRSQNKGAEFMGSFLLLDKSGVIPVKLTADISASVNRFIYRARDDDKMEPLAGIAPHTLSGALRLQLFEWFTLSITDQWRDATLLNNKQEDFANPYHLMLAQGDLQIPIKAWQVRIFGGVNNLLDTSYTSFFQLNNPSGRYFNPAPPRNYFGGIGIGYRFN